MNNLQEEIIENLGTQMQSEIDKEIWWGMLTGIGWTRVVMPRFHSTENCINVFEWVTQHCKNPYERRGNEFIFENEQDAVNFILKWK